MPWKEDGDPAGARDQLAALVPVFERALGVAHKDTRLAHLALDRWALRAVGDGIRGQEYGAPS